MQGSAAFRVRVGFLAAVGLLAGCAKPVPPPSLSIAPPENLFLRTSFDTDPSAYLGRFLPQDDLDLDESRGMALACSTLVSWRYIEGGGVQTSEVFAASSGVQARLGLPPLAHAAGRAGSRRVARVDYTLTGKLVSTVEDPAALAACCKAQPDQCTDRMVGEFLQGTGTVYLEAAKGAELGVEGQVPGTEVDAALQHARGVSWHRAVVFPEPVYFAFKATPTPYRQQPVRTCAGRTDPRVAVADGLVLTAASGPSATERGARRRARATLLEQVQTATGLAAEAEAKGTVLGVQEVDWCVEAVAGEAGTHHEAQVVGVVTEEEQARVRALPWPALPQTTTEPVAKPCAAWVDTPPVSSEGKFVVAEHLLPALTENGARLRARTQLRTRAGWVTGLGAVALAKGSVVDVQERDWCVRRIQTGGKVRYRATVLGFVSHAEAQRLRSLPTLLSPQRSSGDTGR